MAKAEWYQPGEVLDYANSTEETIEAGTVIPIGSRISVAACEIPAGAVGAVHVVGVFKLPKGADAIDMGAALYWDAENEVASATKSDVPCGYCTEAAAADNSVVAVKINA